MRTVFELDEDWQPTPENINALPEPLRRYIHLETLCDPAGSVHENVLLKSGVAALRKNWNSPTSRDP